MFFQRSERLRTLSKCMLQLNQATNQLDLSQLYGTTSHDRKRLRRRNSGKLKSSGKDSGYPTLPLTDQSERMCMQNQTESTICYESGGPGFEI